jgi:hypothetical protein
LGGACESGLFLNCLLDVYQRMSTLTVLRGTHNEGVREMPMKRVIATNNAMILVIK